MKCYVLKKGETFSAANTPKEEISPAAEEEVLALLRTWQARDLHQEGPNSDDYEGRTLYEPLDGENFAVSEGRVVGYYAVHFDCEKYVPFPITGGKYQLGDYDNTDYRNSGRVDRGHVAIVPKPDTDLNPYHDEPGFTAKRSTTTISSGETDPPKDARAKEVRRIAPNEKTLPLR